jgi:hypothetical protein
MLFWNFDFFQFDFHYEVVIALSGNHPKFLAPFVKFS